MIREGHAVELCQEVMKPWVPSSAPFKIGPFWYTSVTTALGRQMQGYQKFRIILSYTVNQRPAWDTGDFVSKTECQVQSKKDIGSNPGCITFNCMIVGKFLHLSELRFLHE